MKSKTYLFIIGGILIVIVLGGYLLNQSELAKQLGWPWNTDRESVDRLEGTPEDELAHDDHDKATVAGISERVFIEHMIPHHQEAVTAAKQVTARGDNAEVKKLAAAIIKTQEQEIFDMKVWYKNWYGTDYKTDETYVPMMQDLSSLSGNTLDKTFVNDMILHHTGALMTTQTVVPNIEHEEIRVLVTSIAEKQSVEIITMRILLKSI